MECSGDQADKRSKCYKVSVVVYGVFSSVENCTGGV